MELDADKLILEDFKDIWFTECQSRYRVLKGARETGKSYNFVGAEPLFKILSDARRNILMVRANDKDNRMSTYTQLKSAAYTLGIAHLFKFKLTPLSITRRTTGQMVIFAGMNDVENITSTTFEHGFWTDIYFEEFSQVSSKDDFDVVDGSLRLPETAIQDGLFCQITMCMNAWDVGHWSNDEFFDGNLDDDVAELEINRYQFKEIPDYNRGYGFGLALHISSYRTNTYRAKAKDKSMEILKAKNYDYYKVVGLGCWGNVGDKTYPSWNDEKNIHHGYSLLNKVWNTLTVGIDFGMSNGEGKIKYSEENAKRLGSANTMQLIGVCDNWDKIVAVDEYFDSNEGRSDLDRKPSPVIAREMVTMLSRWIKKYNIIGLLNCYVDNADSGGFRDILALEAERQGLYMVRFIACTKIPIISRVYFEDYLMGYELIKVSDSCPNLIREIKNARKTKEGRIREDYDDHAINAFEYAWGSIRQKLKRWKTFKEPV